MPFTPALFALFPIFRRDLALSAALAEHLRLVLLLNDAPEERSASQARADAVV